MNPMVCLEKFPIDSFLLFPLVLLFHCFQRLFLVATVYLFHCFQCLFLVSTVLMFHCFQCLFLVSNVLMFHCFQCAFHVSNVFNGNNWLILINPNHNDTPNITFNNLDSLCTNKIIMATDQTLFPLSVPCLQWPLVSLLLFSLVLMFHCFQRLFLVVNVF